MAGPLQGVGHHHAHVLAVVENLRPAEQDLREDGFVLRVAHLEQGRVLEGEYAEHPHLRFGQPIIDARDAAGPHPCLNQGRVHQAR